MTELYKQIKRKREDLNLSQEELATLVGYKSRSTIAKIESGTNDIPQAKIKFFADALKTTPEQLMGWDHTDKITGIHLTGIESWTNDMLLDANQKTVLKEHFAELTSRYKTLVEQTANHARGFNYELEHHTISGDSEELAKRWVSILDTELTALKTWIDTLPKQLGVAAAKKIGTNSGYPNSMKSRVLGDIEVTDEEMELIRQTVEDYRLKKLNK